MDKPDECVLHDYYPIETIEQAILGDDIQYRTTTVIQSFCRKCEKTINHDDPEVPE